MLELGLVGIVPPGCPPNPGMVTDGPGMDSVVDDFVGYGNGCLGKERVLLLIKEGTVMIGASFIGGIAFSSPISTAGV